MEKGCAMGASTRERSRQTKQAGYLRPACRNKERQDHGRILRKIARNEIDHLGDTPTLADPSVVDLPVKGML